MTTNTDPLRLGKKADGCRIALRAAGHDLLRYESALMAAGVKSAPCRYATHSAACRTRSDRSSSRNRTRRSNSPTCFATSCRDTKKRLGQMPLSKRRQA